jgi:hypothetical protein
MTESRDFDLIAQGCADAASFDESHRRAGITSATEHTSSLRIDASLDEIRAMFTAYEPSDMPTLSAEIEAMREAR